jgi:hypothetical protein
MNIFRNITMAAISLSVIASVGLSAPAHAQGTAQGSDAFSDNSGDQGNLHSTDRTQATNGTGNTGAQTQYQAGQSTNPQLTGATNGTIGPQGADATFITGVNTAGTVRVNNLANLEALLNIIANGMEILGIAWGGPTMIMGFMHMAAGTQDSMKRVLFGAAGVTGGLATPGAINWLVASARDANLFS